MTPQDIFIFNKMIFFVFALGLISGAVCTGIFKQLRLFFDRLFYLPRRIKTNNGHLYRYFNVYMPLDLRNKLISERKNKMYSTNPLTSREKKDLIKFLTIFLIMLSLFIFLFIKISNSIFSPN